MSAGKTRRPDCTVCQVFVCQPHVEVFTLINASLPVLEWVVRPPKFQNRDDAHTCEVCTFLLSEYFLSTCSAMQVFVKTLNSATEVLEVTSENTVHDVKAKIQVSIPRRYLVCVCGWGCCLLF